MVFWNHFLAKLMQALYITFDYFTLWNFIFSHEEFTFLYHRMAKSTVNFPVILFKCTDEKLIITTMRSFFKPSLSLDNMDLIDCISLLDSWIQSKKVIVFRLFYSSCFVLNLYLFILTIKCFIDGLVRMMIKPLMISPIIQFQRIVMEVNL